MWALLLGSITSVIQFFLGYFISPGGFGFSRILFGFVDIVCVPVLVPILLYLIILPFKGSSEVNFANFALLWLIPVAGFRALTWSSTNDPILLVITPLLWTALAVGISFFISLMINNLRWYIIIVSILSILILPAAASLTYWAFFVQQTMLGFILLLAAHIPFCISIAFDARHH